jgi:hypothetical protein
MSGECKSGKNISYKKPFVKLERCCKANRVYEGYFSNKSGVMVAKKEAKPPELSLPFMIP